jgi:diacylglycerol kinase (ATP)
MSKYKASNLIISFSFAIRGLLIAVKSQRNFQIDLIIGSIALVSAGLLKFSTIETALLLLTIGFILVTEMLNTVIEFVVDAYFGHKYSILAKMSKDISAGAVLVAAITSVLIGAMLFIPKILTAIGKA